MGHNRRMQFLDHPQAIYIELLGRVNLYLGVGIQVFSSLLLGGLVGYDREKKMKAAGLKTNILICVGACLYTTMSSIYSANMGGLGDPQRVAAQIVSGIGFLGAGAIIQSRGNVTGLTTAATIWVVAAIGYTVGVGYPLSAGIFSLTVLGILKAVDPITRYLERTRGEGTFQLEVLSHGSMKRAIKDTIFAQSLDILVFSEEAIDERNNTMLSTAVFNAHPRMVERICSEIRAAIMVERVSYHVYQGEVSPKEAGE